MNKYYKKIALVMLIIFLLPVATVFCCCMEEAQAAESPVHSHEGVQESVPHGNNHHDSQSTSSHDHGQCDHAMLLSAFTGSKSVDFFEAYSQVFKFQQKHAFANTEFNTVARESPSPPPLDTSPPHGKFSSVPLYLAISVLRI